MTTLADLTVEPRDDAVVARVVGEVDRSNARDIAAALLDAAPNVAVALVLDLSAPTHIDTPGLHLLFDVASRLKRRQQELRAVVPAESHVGRLLSVVALDRTVPVHQTVDEALAGARLQADPER